MDLGVGDAAGAAFETMVSGFDQLLKLAENGSLDGCDPAGQVGFFRAFERFRNRLSLVDHKPSGRRSSRCWPTS